MQVLRGEAGVGKTALLEYIAERAAGCRIVRVGGVESEMELAFAGVHQLCAPMLDGLDGLPGPQRDALRVAFGLEDGATPDRFLVALAVLSLLADAAETDPLVCLVDDAQWLDRASAQTLAFVARRLLAERIAMVFAIREPTDDNELSGLPELLVGGLSEDDARLVLASAMPGRLDEHVRDQIVAETRGNPLALLELPRGLTPAELAGGFGLPDARSPASRVEETFVERVRALPRETQQLLLLAAAEPVGDVSLLWRAAERLRIRGDAGKPAEAAGLIELGIRVRFRHPLIRAAAYRAAHFRDRQEVHRALAEATDRHADPDRRAWHRAQATSGSDEPVAGELERSADRAQRRGGVAAAAAFLERAAELTPDPARRGARALAAAQAKLEAGAPEAAQALLATAELSPLGEFESARLARLRARIAFAVRGGSAALPLLLDAAERMIPLDAELARETLLDALVAAIYAGPFANQGDVMGLAAAARAAPLAHPTRANELLLEGLATGFTSGYVAGLPALQKALKAVLDGGANSGGARELWLACRVASELWDFEAWEELATRGERLTRQAGTLETLPIAATQLAGVHLHAGEYTAASALTDEANAISQATGAAPLIQARPMLAAYQGSESEALEFVEAAREDAIRSGQCVALCMVECARAVLFNGLGRYEEALAAAIAVSEYDGLSLYAPVLVELIEAAARSGQPHAATSALERLADRTRASGTSWALGMEARSRALLTSGPASEPHYQEALERLAGGRVAPHLARAQLVYGEWLRRENRRLDAREQLRAARDAFTRMGAEAFAERARRELVATGETAPKRTAGNRDVLTPQEAQVARMARDRQTNPEIGAQLFISPRTVEYHLRKVFTKLDISSRKELRYALAGVSDQANREPI